MIINEEITDGSAIVYHRDLSTKSFFDLLNGKYKAGTGDYYGRGFYSFINSKSMNFNPSYGNIIYKLKVKNLQNFFFFNVNLYNKLFHSKMKTMEEIIKYQVKKFGITSNHKYFFDTFFDEYGGINGVPKPTLAKSFVSNTNIEDRCNGIIYTGGMNDGDVCVIYPHAYDNIQPLQVSLDGGKSWTSDVPKDTAISYSGKYNKNKEVNIKDLRKEAGKRSQVSTSSTLRDLKPIYVQPDLCVYKQEQPRRYLLADSMRSSNVKGIEFHEGKGLTFFWRITENQKFIEEPTWDLETDEWKFCYNFLKRIPEKIRKIIEKDFNFEWDDLISSHKFIKAKDTKEGLGVEIKKSKIGSFERFGDSMFGKRTEEETTNKLVTKTIRGENGGSIKVKYDLKGDYSHSPDHRRGLSSYTVREKVYKNKEGLNSDALMLYPGDDGNFEEIASSYFTEHPDYNKILNLFKSCKKNDAVNVNYWIKSKDTARVLFCRFINKNEDDSKNAVDIIIHKNQCKDFWNEIIGSVKKVKESQTYDANKKRYDFPNKTVRDEKLKKIKQDLDSGKEFADDSFKKFFDKKQSKAKEKSFSYWKDRNYFERMSTFGYQDKDDKNYDEHDKDYVTGVQKFATKIMGQKIINMSKTIRFTSDGKIFFRFKTAEGKYIDVHLDISKKELSKKDSALVALLYNLFDWKFHAKAEFFLDSHKKIEILKNNKIPNGHGDGYEDDEDDEEYEDDIWDYDGDED